MKKCLLVFALVASMFSVHAGSREDTWFDMLCDGAQKSLPAGAQLRTYPARRIIFIDFPLPIKSKDVDIKSGKKAALEAIKNTSDAEFIKGSNTILIYNYITTDYKVFSIVITKEDF